MALQTLGLCNPDAMLQLDLRRVPRSTANDTEGQWCPATGCRE